MHQVHAGAYHSYLTTEDRRVFGYGWNIAGQCGVGSKEEAIKVPREILVLRGEEVLHMASGAMHGHFVTRKGDFWSVGSNAFGQLGNHSFEDSKKPIRIALPLPGEKVRLLACGDFFTIVVLGRHYAYAWGRNNHCQTGLLRTNCVSKPEICLALNRRCENIVFIACGSDHTVALTKDGGVSQFGSNVAKQFGQCLLTDRTPVLTDISLGGATITHIATSGNTTAAIDANGHLHLWGSRHTIHNGSRTGLAEHPQVVWRCAADEQIRLLRMGRNHLHILTRAGYLYTWVFANWKPTPSPFLTRQYWDYYSSLNDEKTKTTPNRHPNTFLPTLPLEPLENPNLVQNNQEHLQIDDIALDFAASDDQDDESIDDIRPYWLDPSSSDYDSEESDISEAGDPPLPHEESDEDSSDDQRNRTRNQTRLAQHQNHGSGSESSESDDSSDLNDTTNEANENRISSPSHPPPRRVKLPPKPWKSFFVGVSAVRDIACGAFTTQMVMYSHKFSNEFSVLALRPDDYFAETTLLLSDGTSLKVHRFFVKVRCPALLSKSFRNHLQNATPSVIRMVAKYIYYDYCIVSDLSTEDIMELKQLLSPLHLKKSELKASIAAELASREHKTYDDEHQVHLIDYSRRQFKQQMRSIYENRYGTDFQIFASLTPSTSNDDQDPETGANRDVSSSIYVHRAIMAVRCPFFESLCRSDFSERFSGSISLDCTYETLDHFVRYVYYEFTDFTIESATWILQNSNLLFVDKPLQPLKQACIGILRRSGQRNRLKGILEELDPTLDPYVDGKELPEFARSASLSVVSTEYPDVDDIEVRCIDRGSSETIELSDIKVHRKRRRAKKPKTDSSCAVQSSNDAAPDEVTYTAQEEIVSEMSQSTKPPRRKGRTGRNSGQESQE